MDPQVKKFEQVSSVGHQMLVSGGGGQGRGFPGLISEGIVPPMDTPLQIDTTENITFPQLCWWVVMNAENPSLEMGNVAQGFGLYKVMKM